MDTDLSRVSVSRYFYQMITDTSWVVRRVQSVDLVDDTRMIRRESVDIDLAAAHQVAETCRFRPGKDQLLVPLTLTPKGLYDFSIADEAGHPVSVMQSDRCAEVWVGMLLHILEQLPDGEIFRGLFQDGDRESVFLAVREDVSRLVQPADAIRAMGITSAGLAAPGCHELKVRVWEYLSRADENRQYDPWASAVASRWEAWSALWKIERFVDILKCAMENSILMILVDARPERRIVKYDYYDSIVPDAAIGSILEEHKADVYERVYRNDRPPDEWPTIRRSFDALRVHCIRAPKTALDILGSLALHAGRSLAIIPRRIKEKFTVVGTREHLRVGCPDGIRLAGHSFADRDGIQSQSTGFRVIFYARAGDTLSIVDQGTASVYLRPRLGGFWVPALVVLSLATVLSRASSKVAVGNEAVPGFVTLMLLSSSLSSLYVARTGEHLYRAKMLAVPRFAVVLGGISSGVVAAASVFARPSVQAVAGHAYTTCRVLCVYFAVATISGWLQHECSRALSGRIIRWSRQRGQLVRHWWAAYSRHLSDFVQFFRLLWAGGVGPLLLWTARPVRRVLVVIGATLKHAFCLVYGLYDYSDGTRDHVTGRPNVVKNRAFRP